MENCAPRSAWEVRASSGPVGCIITCAPGGSRLLSMLKPSLVPTPLIPDNDRNILELKGVEPPRWSVGLSSLLAFFSLAVLMFRFRIDRVETAVRAVEIRKFIEARGGLWFKIGQMLAARRDTLPVEYCNELEKLQDRSTGFPWSQGQKILEENLGRPAAEVFSEFDEQPIAAASIGQIHQARLRANDVRVAVKIRRPYIESTYRRDLALLKLIARFLDCGLFSRRMRWTEMYTQLSRMLQEELDYRIEAGSTNRMRRCLKAHKIYVPKIFFEYCAREVLVLEWVDAVGLADYARVKLNDPARLSVWLAENNVMPAKLASRLYMSAQRQIMEDNLFHADLHPGNIMLLRNSRICLLDFGAIGTLENGFRKLMRLYNRMLSEGDHARAMAVMLRLCAPLPPVDVQRLLKELVVAYQSSVMVSTSKAFRGIEKSSHSAATQQARILSEHNIPVNWDFLRVTRCGVALEASTRLLDSEIQFEKLMKRYLDESDRRIRAAQMPQIGNRLFSYLEDSSEVQADAVDKLALFGERTEEIIGAAPRLIQFGSDLIRGVHMCLRIAIIVLAIVFLYQHYTGILPHFLRPWVGRLSDTLPPLGTARWLTVAVIVLVVRWTIVSARRYLEVR